MKNIEEAQERLSKGKYLDWCNAGGPNECAHGYADGIPCRRCDEALASRLPTPVEPKAQVESASVGAISDHEKGQKEEFYKFQQHLEKTQEEISKWPSWMREAGRASMGLDQREPAKVEAGDGVELVDQLSEAAYALGNWSTLRESSQETIDYWTKRVNELKSQLKASLLREKELREQMIWIRDHVAAFGKSSNLPVVVSRASRVLAAVKGD